MHALRSANRRQGLGKCGVAALDGGGRNRARTGAAASEWAQQAFLMQPR